MKLKRVITKGYTNCIAQYDPPKNLKLSAVLYQSSYSTADWSVSLRGAQVEVFFRFQQIEQHSLQGYCARAGVRGGSGVIQHQAVVQQYGQNSDLYGRVCLPISKSLYITDNNQLISRNNIIN